MTLKVAITGATGFLGSHLAEVLTERGAQVRAIVRGTSDTRFLRSLGAEIVDANLHTGEGLGEAVSGVDAVVHGAAVVKARSEAEFHQVNAGGTERVLEAVKKHNPQVKRFVYVSSLAAHGFSDDGNPRGVHDEARPVTHYGRSKLAGERMVLAAKDVLPVSVIRPPAIYGPRDAEMFAFFQVVSRRLMPFMGDPNNTLSIVYARDAATAIYLALTKPHASGSVYFVEDGRVYTQEQMGMFIAQSLGVQAIKLPVPIAAVSVVAGVSELYGRFRSKAVMLTRDKVNELKQPYIVCGSEEIRRDLGWVPEMQFPEGARVTADWYKSQGWL